MAWFIPVGVVALVFICLEIGFRSGCEAAHRNELKRMDSLIEKIAELDVNALLVMCDAAQQIAMEKAQIRELKQMAGIK